MATQGQGSADLPLPARFKDKKRRLEAGAEDDAKEGEKDKGGAKEVSMGKGGKGSAQAKLVTLMARLLVTLERD
eukprot:1792032-Pyramimonas_sp.AAC.1